MNYCSMMKIRNSLIGILLCLGSLPAVASYLDRSDVQQFVAEMVNKHDFDKTTLIAWLSDVKKRQSVINAIMRPAEGKPWKEYRPIFVTKKRIKKGVKFWKQNREILEKAEQTYGVPAEIIVAIIGVETFYGKQSGRYPVLDVLATLGFDYPPRAEFFRSELEQYLLLARDEKLSLRKTLGSYAGAMGMAQFISSSYRNYAVDFDNDGKKDLWHSTADAIGSVANYFKRHGWQPGASVTIPAIGNGRELTPQGRMMKPDTVVSEFRAMGLEFPTNIAKDDDMAVLVKLDGKKGVEYWLGLHNFYVITRYNHSPLYAMAVYQLSQAVAEGVRKGW